MAFNMRIVGQRNPTMPRGTHKARQQPKRIAMTRGVLVACSVSAILAVVAVGIISCITYMFRWDSNQQYFKRTFYPESKGSLVPHHRPGKKWLSNTNEIRVSKPVEVTTLFVDEVALTTAFARYDKHEGHVFTSQPQLRSRPADEHIKDDVHTVKLSSVTGKFSVNVTYFGFQSLPGGDDMDATKILDFQILESLFQIAPIAKPMTLRMEICLSNAKVDTLDFRVPDMNCTGSDEVCRRMQTLQQQIKVQVTLLVQDLANNIDVHWRNSDPKNYKVTLAVQLHDEPKSPKWLPRHSKLLAERVLSNYMLAANHLVKAPHVFAENELELHFSDILAEVMDAEGQLVQSLVKTTVTHCRQLGLIYTMPDLEASADYLITSLSKSSHATAPQQDTKEKSSLTIQELLDPTIDALGRIWDGVATSERDHTAATCNKFGPTIPSLLEQTKQTWEMEIQRYGISYTEKELSVSLEKYDNRIRKAFGISPLSTLTKRDTLSAHIAEINDAVEEVGKLMDEVTAPARNNPDFQTACLSYLAPVHAEFLLVLQDTFDENNVTYTIQELVHTAEHFNNRVRRSCCAGKMRVRASIGEDMSNLGPASKSIHQKIDDIAHSHTDVENPTNAVVTPKIQGSIGCRQQGREWICPLEGFVEPRYIANSAATQKGAGDLPRGRRRQENSIYHDKALAVEHRDSVTLDNQQTRSINSRKDVEDIQNDLLLQATMIRGDNRTTSDDSMITDKQFPGSSDSMPDGTFNDIRVALGRGIERAGKYMDQFIDKGTSSKAFLEDQTKPTTWQYIKYLREVCHDQELVCTEEDIIMTGRKFENRLRSSLQLGPIERLAKRSPPKQNAADHDQGVQFAATLTDQLVQIFPNSKADPENTVRTKMYALAEGIRHVSHERNVSHSEDEIKDATAMLRAQFRGSIGLATAESRGVEAKCQIEQDPEKYISDAAQNFDQYLVSNCKSREECEGNVQECIERFKTTSTNVVNGNFTSTSAMCPEDTIEKWAPVLETRLQGLVDTKFPPFLVKNTQGCLLDTDPDIHISELVQEFNTETLPTCGTREQCKVAVEVYSGMFKAGGFPVASGCSPDVLGLLTPDLELRLYEEVNTKFPQPAKRDQECLLQNKDSFEFEFLGQTADLFIMLTDPADRDAANQKIGNQIKQLPFAGCTVQDMKVISQKIEKRLDDVEPAVMIPRADSCQLMNGFGTSNDDLVGTIGNQILEYAEDKEDTLIDTASSLLIMLLRDHDTKDCNGNDLDAYSSRLETEIRASLDRTSALNETQDSAEVELGIFQLRVIVDSFLNAYSIEMVEDYVKYFVNGFTGLTTTHSADEVEKFLVQIFLESKKLRQVSAFRQLELTMDDDIAFSLQKTSGWSRVEVSRMTREILLLLNSFFQSTSDVQQRLVEEYTRKLVEDLQANSQNREMLGLTLTETDSQDTVHYFSTLMADFERYFVEFTEALRLVYLHPASLMHGRDEIPNIKHLQVRDGSNSKTDGQPNKNGTTSSTPNETEGKFWSTSGVIAFAVTFGIMGGLLSLFIWRAWKTCHHRRHPNVEEPISECCETQPPPSKLRGILRTKPHSTEPLVPAQRYHDEVDRRANLTAASPTNISTDGTADGWTKWISSPRGNEIQAAKRLHTADHVPAPRLPSLQLPKPAFQIGRRASDLPPSVDSLRLSPTKKKRITWGSTV